MKKDLCFYLQQRPWVWNELSQQFFFSSSSSLRCLMPWHPAVTCHALTPSSTRQASIRHGYGQTLPGSEKALQIEVPKYWSVQGDKSKQCLAEPQNGESPVAQWTPL